MRGGNLVVFACTLYNYLEHTRSALYNVRYLFAVLPLQRSCLSRSKTTSSREVCAYSCLEHSITAQIQKETRIGHGTVKEVASTRSELGGGPEGAVIALAVDEDDDREPASLLIPILHSEELRC